MKSKGFSLSFVVFASLLALTLACSGCGGSTGGDPQPPPPPPPVLQSIAVTPANPSVVVGASQQFVATGKYDKGGDKVITSSVTWTSSDKNVATIATGGMAQAKTAGTSTITATLGSVSGSTVLTVPQRVITIATSVPSIYLDKPGAIVGIPWTSSGIIAGDQFCVLFLGVTSCQTFTAPPNGQAQKVTVRPMSTEESRAMVRSWFSLDIGTPMSKSLSSQGNVQQGGTGQFQVDMGFGSAQFNASNMKFWVIPNGSATANVAFLDFLGNLQPLMAKSGTYAFYAPGGMLMQRYLLSDGSSQGQSSVGGMTVAFDTTKNALVVGDTTDMFWLGGDTFQVTGGCSNSISDVYGVAADNGLGFLTEPDGSGLLATCDLSQTNPPTNTTSLGGEPWTLNAGPMGNNGHYALVYSRENTTLSLFDASLNLKSALPLSGITKRSQIPLLAGGQQIFFRSGTVTFLSLYDGTVVFGKADPSTFTLSETSGATITGTSAGMPRRIAPDFAHGKVIVAFSTDSGTYTFGSLDPATGKVTPLSVTTAYLPAAMIVSDDGKSLYVGGVDLNTGKPVFKILPNN